VLEVSGLASIACNLMRRSGQRLIAELAKAKLEAAGATALVVDECYARNTNWLTVSRHPHAHVIAAPSRYRVFARPCMHHLLLACAPTVLEGSFDVSGDPVPSSPRLLECRRLDF
jgi:hypothetical protein